VAPPAPRSHPSWMMEMDEEIRPPLPPFSAHAAAKKVRAAEDAWNSRNPELVASAYTQGSRWRNRSLFLQGRGAIVRFLNDKWSNELDYRLVKELWAFGDNRISVRFAYEWRDGAGQWYRSYGNEQWEFALNGLMARREASVNDVMIEETERLFRWPLGRRPDDYPSLTQLGL